MTKLKALIADDEPVARTLRGHLELVGITTAARLAEATTLPPGRVASGLAMLQRDGFARKAHPRECQRDQRHERQVGERCLEADASKERRKRVVVSEDDRDQEGGGADMGSPPSNRDQNPRACI